MFLLALAGASTRVTAPNALPNTVFELRDYLLRPAQRDVLIELFERELVESQEALGATIVGTFRNIDVPERFVCIRSFVDMDARRRALAEIYSGPAWLAHRGAANATIVDSSNVYLLRPIGDPPPTNLSRLPLGSQERHRSMFVVDLYAQGTEKEVAFHANAAHVTRSSPLSPPSAPRTTPPRCPSAPTWFSWRCVVSMRWQTIGRS